MVSTNSNSVNNRPHSSHGIIAIGSPLMDRRRLLISGFLHTLGVTIPADSFEVIGVKATAVTHRTLHANSVAVLTHMCEHRGVGIRGIIAEIRVRQPMMAAAKARFALGTFIAHDHTHSPHNSPPTWRETDLLRSRQNNSF